MVKTQIIFALAVACFISSAWAAGANTNSQDTMQSTAMTDMTADLQKLKTQFSSSSLGRLFEAFFQVSNGASIDYNPLFNALRDLAKSIKKRRNQENKDYNDAKINYNKYKEELERVIRELSTLIAESKQKIENKLKKDVKYYQDSIENDKKMLKEDQEQKEKLTKTREVEHDTFIKTIPQIRAAIDAVDECLSLLSSLRSGNANLAQVKSETVKDLMEGIKEKTFKLQGFEFAPMVTAMMEIAMNQNFVDRAAAEKVVGLLNQVRTNLVNLQSTLEKNEASAVASFKQMIATIDQSIANYRKKLAEDTKALSETQAEIRFTLRMIKVSTAQKKKYTDSLEGLTRDFETRTKQHQDMLVSFTKDLDLIKQVGDVLNAHGIQRGFHA